MLRKWPILVKVLTLSSLLLMFGALMMFTTLNKEQKYLLIKDDSGEIVSSFINKLNQISADVLELNDPSTSMSDPRVIELIKLNFLIKQSPANVPYKLSYPELKDTSMGQAEKINQILNGMKNGFFVECGALDGETRSNTLFFERELHWSGLLIEADPINFVEMMEKKRKAYLSPSCLSIVPYPNRVMFKQGFNIGKIFLGTTTKEKESRYVDVQCFPLYSYLLALNKTVIDYFSLDVEGFELEVLETIPFDKVLIRTLSVEYIHGSKGKEAIKEFMEKKGFITDSEVVHSNNLANDFIFVHPSVMQSRSSSVAQ